MDVLYLYEELYAFGEALPKSFLRKRWQNVLTIFLLLVLLHASCNANF